MKLPSSEMDLPYNQATAIAPVRSHAPDLCCSPGKYIPEDLRPAGGGSAHRRKRFRVRAGIVDGDFDGHVPEIGSRAPALNRVELFRMRVAQIIRPELIVKSDRIDHQRIFIPVTDGVPVPGRVGIFGMLPVHKDLPEAMNVALKQHEINAGRLSDSPRIRSAARNAGGHAIGLGIVLRFPRLHQRFGPRQRDSPGRRL